MTRLKTIGIWLLLIVLTAAIVVVPPLWSERQSATMANMTQAWEYTGYSSTPLTSAQLATMYWNGNIDIGMYATNIWQGEKFDAQDAYFATRDMIGAVFRDSPMAESLALLSEDRLIAYDASMGLVMHGGHPVALYFIENTFQLEGGECYSFIFEQKTNTLLYMSYYSEAMWDFHGQARWIHEVMCPALRQYYGEQLGLAQEQFVCWEEQTALYAYGGVLQKEMYTEKDAEDDQIYNNGTY